MKPTLPPMPEPDEVQTAGAHVFRSHSSEALRAFQLATIEWAAQMAEQSTHRTRQAKAWANCEPIKPCEAASAIRAAAQIGQALSREKGQE